MSSSHFDAIAAAYDESLPAHVVEHYLRKRTALRASRTARAARALDVGCGTGVLAARLAARRLRGGRRRPVRGHARRAARQRRPRSRAVRASGTALPVRRTTASTLVLTVAVMHHIADAGRRAPDAREMVRVTRPGGRILVWDHNPRNPYWRLLMARVPQDTGEERLIPEDELLGRAATPAGAGSLLSSQLGTGPRLRAASRPPRRGRRRAGRRAHPPRPPALRPQRHPCRADRSAYTLTTTLSSPG